MKKGMTFAKMDAEAAKAAAAARHKAAVAEGRVCACEGPHVATCPVAFPPKP